MDTQVATKQIRIREWAAIIQNRINSGMTVNAYCAQHGLTRNGDDTGTVLLVPFPTKDLPPG